MKKIKSNRKELLENIIFSYISWEDIHECFNTLDLKEYTEYEKLIASDIIELLLYKGLIDLKVFQPQKVLRYKRTFF